MTEQTEHDEPYLPKIRTSRIPEVRERVAKANRRLAKAGIEQRFELLLGEEETREVRDPHTHLVTERYAVRTVELSTPAIAYNGWTFVATLSFEEGGTVVRTVPGQSCAYRPTDKVCDQCHTARERTETFVVRNEAGEYRQLGRNCLELFLGVKPSLWVFEVELSDYDVEREGGGYARGVEIERVEQIVAAALAVTDGGPGYVSKAAAEFSGVATSVETWSCLYENPVGRFAEERRRELAAWREAAQGYLADGTVAQVIEAAKAIEGDSDYAENIRVLANSEWVGVKNIGYVASFVAVWNRANQRAAERKARAERKSAWIGAVGDKKVATSGTVTAVRYIEGNYGTTTLVEWLTTDGLTCKWFASNPGNVEVGDAVSVTGTIKKHDEYKGLRCTVFTRCALEVAE